MGLGSFFKDIGHAATSTIKDVSGALNTVDRYINPFHVEPGSSSAADQAKYNQPLGNIVVRNEINPTLEHVSNGLNWLYSNGVSQPISTAMMAGNLKGGPFNANNWVQAWHAANHISPGQALFLNPAQTQRAVNSPLDYFKPDSSQLPPGFDQLPQAQQQEFLKNAGMPVVGNAYIDELKQSHRYFSNASGVGDFALRWFGDPTVVGGKAISAGRQEFQVMRRPTTGWSANDIDKIMNKSVMTKATDFVFKNRNNPALLNNLAMVQHSALGPRFGAVASLLRSPDEVQDFVRVTLGDVGAIERLNMKNELAASRLAQDTSRLDRLGLMHTTYTNQPAMQQLIEQHMELLNRQINSDTLLTTAYENVLNHAGEMDQVNLSRWSTARAQARYEAQRDYRAAPARGRLAGRSVSITPTPVLSRGTSTPIDLGFNKTRLYGVGDFFSTPITVVRSFANSRPNGYMRIDDIDQDSINELRGQLARIPNITTATRDKFLNDYLKTQTEAERIDLLDSVGRIGAAKIAKKHGLDPEMGHEIYMEHLKRQIGEKDQLKRYSAAYKPVVLPSGEVARIRVDEFATDGGKLVVHPNLVTRLAQDHVFQDLGEMDKVMARHGSALSAIRTSRLGNPDWIRDTSDYLTSLFKFGTLFRLGYIPRVAGDDLAGQWARLGSAAMALRAGWGVRNGATNAAMWLSNPMDQAKLETAKAGVQYASDKMAELEQQMAPLRQQVQGRRASTRRDLTLAGRRLASARNKLANLSPNARPATRAALNTLIAKHEANVASLSRSMSTGVAAKNIRLRDLEAHHGFLDHYRGLQQRVADDAQAKLDMPKAIQGSRPVNLGNGVTAPAAFAGKEGEYYQKLATGDEALGQIFMTNKQIIHGHLMRSFDHGAKPISAAQDETLHATSWAHAINNQLVQDPLAMRAIQGANAEQMADWLAHTPAGRAYRRRIGLVSATNEDLAEGAWHDVAEYMPLPEIRQKALEPGGVTPDFLKKSMPMAQRPEVHTGQIGASQVKYKRALDEIQQKWFHMAAEIPANRLSRHPLFNQLYTGHLQSLKNTLVKQGAYDTTVEGVERMATTARRLALRDTRRLVFDIVHRSDASAALRFISPFMTATNESFQRWGRILVDKPQVAGYANNLFNAPIAMGSMQDADGNHIGPDGYAYTMQYPTNPATGEVDYTKGKAVRTLVPKSQRYIIARLPHSVMKNRVGKYTIGAFFGAEPASGNLKLSQNSANLVTQGDPWFSPGVGPIVQIPVNEFVKDKPKMAEIARHLDILPFGPQQGSGVAGNNLLGRSISFFAPSTVKNALTAFDTSDERYQSVKLQILQRAAFEHETLGKPMPSAKQIADQVRNYWLFSAATAFLQPMATQKQDKYQFYRDQYNAFRRADPRTADDEFLSRYAESYFIFAQAQSKNVSGIQATTKAVELSKKYADLLSANPELGALIVGPDGNGPFSPEAYSYQLNTPLAPGGAEMQRTKMSADEALAENKRRLGWSKYTKMVTQLTAELHNRGLKSFNDKGAEDLKQTKSNYTNLWSKPLYPDGSPNPYYNDEWSKDYSTLDPLKYDRLIPGLTDLSRSPLADQTDRTDLRTLQTYLGGRQALLAELNRRYQVNQASLIAEGKTGQAAKTITAKANSDLAQKWQEFVDNLIEGDTRFGELHSRYLSRDMNYDNSIPQGA